MSDEPKIFESPDGGKTVYERGVNEPISARRKVEDTRADDYDVPAWKYIRQDYEDYILKINNLIELHEMKFTNSREDFHKKATRP